MTPTLETVLDAALQLPLDQKQELIKRLLEANGNAVKKEKGKLRLHFGSWDSGNERSADNEEIDRDLAQVYAENHIGED
ncbi:MAG TPA: hypothetical protein VF596_06750 [Pyrinomonadaceae bacterium]|jgi:hypothetical protein